jgi:hypothetical protein
VVARFQRVTEPFDYEVHDLMLVSDLVDNVYLPLVQSADVFPSVTRRMGYVCMANDTNMKKKKFKYVWTDDVIPFAFETIDEVPLIPSRWLIDMLLVWRE